MPAWNCVKHSPFNCYAISSNNRYTNSDHLWTRCRDKWMNIERKNNKTGLSIAFKGQWGPQKCPDLCLCVFFDNGSYTKKNINNSFWENLFNVSVNLRKKSTKYSWPYAMDPLLQHISITYKKRSVLRYVFIYKAFVSFWGLKPQAKCMLLFLESPYKICFVA